jgi:hypothetical protein
MIDAQTSPMFRVDVIAPSPDALIIVEARFSEFRLRHKRTQRMDVCALTVFWALCFYNISLRRTNPGALQWARESRIARNYAHSSPMVVRS